MTKCRGERNMWIFKSACGGGAACGEHERWIESQGRVNGRRYVRKPYELRVERAKDRKRKRCCGRA